MSDQDSTAPPDIAGDGNSRNASDEDTDSSIGATFAPVFDAEIEHIRRRRAACNIPTPGDDPLDLPTIEPAADYNRLSDTFVAIYAELHDNDAVWASAARAHRLERGLIGLALSGGGIRSSTFNLGIMQALQNVGLFPFIDYLSTVSGGGYIGSFVSSSILEEGSQTPLDDKPMDRFPLTHTVGEVENERVRHLRNYSNFLAPNGNHELLTAPLLLLRGFVVNGLFLIPIFLLIAWGLAHMIGYDGTAFALRYPAILQDAFSYIPGVKYFPATLAVFLLLIALFIAYPFAYRFAEAMSWSPMSRRRRREKYQRALRIYVGGMAIVFVVESIPHTLNLMHSVAEMMLTIGLAGLLASVPFADRIAQSVSVVKARLGASFYGGLGILVIWLITLVAVKHFAADPARYESIVWGLLAVLALAFLLLDVNSTSIHRYYRDHLVKAFIAQAAADDAIEGPAATERPVPKLSELQRAEFEQAAYPIVNTTVNVSTVSEEYRYRNGRRASFFSFGPHYCGGIRTGYVATAKLEHFAPDLDLGCAMAISGAAASPNMGRMTNRFLAFILGLFNVRLNYWLPNPARVNDLPDTPMRRVLKVFDRVGPLYLLYEMLGRLDTKHRFVNLSDGGHIENLGVYELLRRQCRLIIVGDGECDPGLSFDGLSEVIRLARIDFGFHIEMDGLDEIRSGDQQYAVGTIYYGLADVNGRSEDRYGKLIYIKANLGGDYNLESTLETDFYRTSSDRDDDRRFDANAYVAHYKTLRPDFPQESTADQFFDEAQFENYRALGWQVACSVLRAPRQFSDSDFSTLDTQEEN